MWNVEPPGKSGVFVNVRRNGFGEKNLLKVKENEVIQAERFGFLRLDKKLKNKLVFFFGHK